MLNNQNIMATNAPQTVPPQFLWNPYPEHPSDAQIEIWKTYPEVERYLTNETASCRFFLEDMEIYESTLGKYYWFNMGNNPKGIFAFGDTYVTDELNPMPEESMDKVRDLLDASQAVEPYGFYVVQIVYIDPMHVMFSLYSQELDVYCEVERESFEAIGPDTHKQLEALKPMVNTLATPFTVVLDDDGNVLRGVATLEE